MPSTTRMPQTDTDNPVDIDHRNDHRDDQDPRQDPSQPSPDNHPSHRLDLSFSQVAGGALAAMTAAALGSRLGVAGTIVGAALASVCAAVLGSIYTLSIRRTREAARSALNRATPVLRTTRGRQQVPARPGSGGRRLTLTEGDLGPVRSPVTTGDVAPEPLPGRTRTPRRRLVIAAAIGSAAIFVITLGAIFGIETVSGRALDGQSGGTTLGQVVHGSKHHKGSDSTSKKSSDRKSSDPSAASSSDPSAGAQPSADASDPAGQASSEPSAPASDQPGEQSSGQPSAPADQPSERAGGGTDQNPGSGSSAGSGSGAGAGGGSGAGQLSGPGDNGNG